MEHFGYYASALLYRFSGRELSHANRLDTRRNFLNILRKRQPYWAVFTALYLIQQGITEK